MFDLIKAVKGENFEIRDLEEVTAATVVTAQGARACESVLRQATPDDKLSINSDELRCVALGRQAAKAREYSESKVCHRCRQCHHLSGNLLNFLEESPFTLHMLEKGTEKWQEPFSADELCDLLGGLYPRERAIEYLYWWMKNKPGRYKQLQSIALPVAEALPIKDEVEALIDNGLHILREDFHFIRLCLYGISGSMRMKMVREYERTWNDAMEKEPVIHHKQNRGRKSANEYLRSTCKAS